MARGKKAKRSVGRGRIASSQNTWGEPRSLEEAARMALLHWRQEERLAKYLRSKQQIIFRAVEALLEAEVAKKKKLEGYLRARLSGELPEDEQQLRRRILTRSGKLRSKLLPTDWRRIHRLLFPSTAIPVNKEPAPEPPPPILKWYGRGKKKVYFADTPRRACALVARQFGMKHSTVLTYYRREREKQAKRGE